MKNIFNKMKNKKGYAILFTVIIIGSISALAAGLANTTYKQLILSSLVKNSQSAFYQADTAADCALYAELVYFDEKPDLFKNGGAWVCGKQDLKILPLGDEFISYNIYPEDEESVNPCFRINVKKFPPVDTETQGVKITAKGYNICDTNNPRVVEREIEINY